MELTSMNKPDYMPSTAQLEAGYDRAQLLRLILTGTGITGVVLALLLIVLGFTGTFAREPAILSAGVSMLVAGASAFAYYVVQRGLIVTAVRVFAIAQEVLVLLAMLVYGGTDSPVTILLLVPLGVVGLLGTARDTWTVAGLGVAGYIVLFALQISMPNSVPLYPLDRNSGIVGLTMLVAGTALLGIITSSVRTSLKDALRESQARAEKIFTDTERLLEKSVQQVELGSELSAAAAELQATSQQQASGATEQASAVSQVTTTVEELGTTARQIAQSADHVAQAAQQTLEHLSDGQQAVDETIQAMERIRVRMQDISVRVLGLGERSQQIGEIIDLIDDISDETHLLALNAAIEAAGAGEHGRRFSVVAAEVKNLANRTLQAAKEVKDVIAEIRQATNAAVLAAEEGGKEVEKGSELTYRAGQVMDTILIMAERTAQSGAEIGMATAQQQSASEQVVEAMREIAEVARQTASGARQMADSSSMLSAIADRLHGVAQGQ